MNAVTEFPSVLIIDDEVNVVNAIKRTLRSEPFNVQVSTDPVQALEMARQLKPAAVVCDMRMPGMDGAQVFTTLKTELPDCARILLTGYADITSTIAAINQGRIDRYLTKPWNDEELRDVLHQQIGLVNLKRERDQLAASLAEKVDELELLTSELDRRVVARTQEIHQTTLFLEQAYSELQTQFLNAVKVFSNLMEMSAPSMMGHGRRVGEMARFLAIELKLPEAEIRDIYVAGLLHDIGKIGLSEKVLTSPYTQLEPGDRVALMKHCQKGHDALMALPELHNVAHYVMHHHERIDGKGFPGGLSETEIPRGAQVLAVAEDWDELQMGLLTSHKLDLKASVEFIQQGSGKRYAPSVVAVLPTAVEQLQSMPRDHEQLLRAQTLAPGMILSRDLCGPDGMLLMAKGGVVSSKLIQYLKTFDASEYAALRVYCARNLKQSL